MCKILPDAKAFVLTYHKGTQRSFIFLIHPEDFKKYNKVVQSFMYDNWHKIFSEEYTENGDPAKEQIGERFTIECLHGRLMFFCCLMGHWI